MHMNFWFDYVFQNFLFKGYNITSFVGLLATCLGLASLTVFLEAIKVYRASISVKKSDNAHTRQPQEVTSVRILQQRNRNVKLKHLTLQTTLFTVHDVIGYIVMMVVMTFNGYLTVAVVLGSALGYYLFGPWLMDIKLNAGTVCSKQQKCSVCIAKMERSHLLSSSSALNYDTSSTNDTNGSLAEVAEGLASVMQGSSEERVAVEVHSQELCTT